MPENGYSIHHLPSGLEPLTKMRHWVLWKLEERNGKPTKVPYQIDGELASTNKPRTWGYYETVLPRADKYSGIGFCLLGSDLAAFDLDKCRNAETGEVHPWAMALVERCHTYTEVTPSKTGLRIIGQGLGPAVQRKQPVQDGVTVETYRDTPRYITMTGDVLPGFDLPLANIDPIVGDVVRELEEREPEPEPEEGQEEPAPELEDVIQNGRYERWNGDRSNAVWYVCCECLRRAWSDEAILKVLLDRGNRISEHIYDQGNPTDYAREQIKKARKQPVRGRGRGITRDHFFAYMVMHNYIFAPTGELWPGSSVNARLGPIPIFDSRGQPVMEKVKAKKEGEEEREAQKTIPANVWLDTHRPVDQLTWFPGRPQVIRNQLILDGGWVEQRGASVFNLYRAPTLIPGDPTKAGRWLELVRKLYPDDADHIVNYLAHRVQFPGDKLNHSLFLGGAPGIGKDTLLEAVKRAVGAWNFKEVSPSDMMDTFSPHLKAVVIRISEARDLGEFDRFKFYDRTKVVMAAPPDVLRVNEKNVKQYYVPNVCAVIITSNRLTDGIYLPADDRRHYVAWSEVAKEEFGDDHWNRFWYWYNFEGGDRDVAAYLAKLDLSKFDPKAPPPKTPAFWQIVDANRAPEESELSDVIDSLGSPRALTLDSIRTKAAGKPIGDWLGDRKNGRLIPHRLEKVGYVQVRNEAAKDGYWRVDGERRAVYARQELPLRQRFEAAGELARKGSPV